MPRDGLHERTFGGFHVALPKQGQAEIDERFQPIRAFAHAVTKWFDATRVIFSEQPVMTQTKPGFFVLRLALEDLLDALLSFSYKPETLEDDAQVPLCGSILRRILEGAFIGFARRGQIAAFLQRSAKVDVRGIAVRPQLDSFRVRLPGLLQAAGLLVGDAEVEPGRVGLRSG